MNTPESASIRWLEEEHQQFKAGFFKLQQQFEQLQSLIWSLGDRVNTVETALTTSVAQSARLNRAEEDLRHNKDLLELLQGYLSKLQEAGAEMERQRQTDQERQTRLHVELQQGQDALGKEQATQLERLQTVEELRRRRQEEEFRLDQAIEEQRSVTGDLHNALVGLGTQLSRHAQDLETLHQDQESLHAEDEVISGRIAHLTDQVRRLEAAEDLKAVEERLRQTTAELG